jgi:hypothetical protein
LSSTGTTSFINDKSTVYTKINLDFGKMRMRKKWILPGSCAAHKMGRKSAYFRVHAHVHLAGSGGMRMCLTLNGYGISTFANVHERSRVLK